MKGRAKFQLYYKDAFGGSFQVRSVWAVVPLIAQHKLEEFEEEKPHLILLCPVEVFHSNLVFGKEKPDLHTPMQ